jgi:predicted DNA-binding transcriptional regulator AlpA
MTSEKLPDLLRTQDVCDRYQISRQTLHRWTTEQKFPAPMRLPGKHPVWSEDAIVAWEETRKPTRRSR